jgi:hypothetical protein
MQKQPHVQILEQYMTERPSNSQSGNERINPALSLGDGEIAQLLLASSLAATRPLQGLIMLLIQEGILDREKLKIFLEPMLSVEQLPSETKAMLAPIWKAFIAEISVSNPRSPSTSEKVRDN